MPSVFLPSGILHKKVMAEHGKLEWFVRADLARTVSVVVTDQRWRVSCFGGGPSIPWHSSENIRELSKTAPVIIYIHGGGYCLCSTKSHRRLIYDVANTRGKFQNERVSSSLVLAVTYRRVPEHSVDDAVEDCLKAFQYLTNVIGVNASRISLMGDSAGASLALQTALRLKADGRQGKDMPNCLVLLSPWVDLQTPPVDPTYMKTDYLTHRAVTACARHVVGASRLQDGTPKYTLSSPELSPVHADLVGLPPTLISYGGGEILRPTIEAFDGRMREANVSVETYMHPIMPHVPELFTFCSPEARAAIQKDIQFVVQRYEAANSQI